MDVKSSYMVLGGTALISLGMGAISGYLLARRELEAEYIAVSQKEIAEAKQFYSALNKKGKYSTPQAVVKDRIPDGDVEVKAIREANAAVKAAQATRGYRGDDRVDYTKPNEDADGKPIVSEDGFDYEEEIKHRTPHAPYVISKEEFFSNEFDYEQFSITYFIGDDVVSDEKDGTIDNSDEIIGDENLLRFGEGSGDPHVVYVRNEKLSTDFEVITDTGKYSEKILGFSHADRRSSRKRDKKTKFKGGDDE